MFSKLLYIINISRYKKEQLKLHYISLCKVGGGGGGGQKQPYLQHSAAMAKTTTWGGGLQ